MSDNKRTAMIFPVTTPLLLFWGGASAFRSRDIVELLVPAFVACTLEVGHCSMWYRSITTTRPVPARTLDEVTRDVVRTTVDEVFDVRREIVWGRPTDDL